ncbi:response regulator transcription factor [Ruania suaedae]|uniref:response regulator n=1 Tax=Ruania suaedae TaxID=2897774 RepID=UPI001E509013|nr:response regulator transcription factor [Ruania suaedae]UFU03819.1 response regulator transcription factor [Ruania suaedae]
MSPHQPVSEPPPVRVLIADDEALMRSGLRLMVDGVEGITVVGEAADGSTALAQAQALDPDVVLMDIRMPGCSGLEATRHLREAGTRAQVIMLTAYDTEDHLLEALRAGAVSFLLKDSHPETVLAAIHDAASGQSQFSPAVLTRLVALAAATDRASETDSTHDRDSTPPAQITPREWEVGRFVAQGLTNSEIAEAMYVSTTTVKTHLGHLFEKLHVTNRVQLALRILERQI